MKYIVNCRYATQQATGVQRFAYECSLNVAEILEKNVEFVAPKGKIEKKIKSTLNIKQIGIFKGHLWEQIDLPLYCFFKKSLLISFCSLPPIFYKKTIYTIHDLAYFRYPDFFNAVYSFIYKIVIKLTFKNILSINTVSEFTKSEAIDLLGNRQIDIVNNSINHMVNQNQKSQLPTVLKDKKFLLVVGSLDPRKNTLSLIRSFIKEKTDYYLVIVGDKNKVFAKNDDFFKVDDKKIIFTGYLEDFKLRACYENAECFFYPSLYEGFGIPPLEAIFYNAPLAISDIPVHKEIFKNYAVFYDPNDIKNLNELIKISQILKEKNKKNGIRSDHPLVIKYSKENQKNQLKKIIFSLDSSSSRYQNK